MKALQAIERLVSTDFGADMECFLYEVPEKRKYNKATLKKNLKQAAKIITEIYCISHAENSRCSHSNWEKKKYEILSKPEE